MSNIVVISCNYNGDIFVRKNILSVFNQTYKPKKHYFIDDISTDGCVEIAKKTILYNKIDNIKLIENKEKFYKIRNLYNIIHNEIDDNDIIVILDGDDWLVNNSVLEKINCIYKQNNCKYMYSNFVFSHNFHPGISRKIPSNLWNPYISRWITSHISTFKASEFKKINYKNFVDNNENWFEMGCDQAYVLPILENIRNNGKLSSDVFFTSDIMYVYNFIENPSKQRNGIFQQAFFQNLNKIRHQYKKKGK